MTVACRLWIVVLLVVPFVAACAEFPEVVKQTPDTGPYPALKPIDELLAQADQPSARPAP
jgi:hypothetical protein